MAQHANTNTIVVIGCHGTRTMVSRSLSSSARLARARNTNSDAPVNPKNNTSIETT
jgi:hypothetical protein